MKSNFQAGVNTVYNAVVAKGVTPASYSLSDIVDGISSIIGTASTTMSISATNNGSNNVTQYSDFSISNSQWNNIKIGGWTHSHSSSSAYIKIGSTTIWSNGSPTTKINISAYKGQTILFHAQVYGAYQSTSIDNIVLSN